MVKALFALTYDTKVTMCVIYFAGAGKICSKACVCLSVERLDVPWAGALGSDYPLRWPVLAWRRHNSLRQVVRLRTYEFTQTVEFTHLELAVLSRMQAIECKMCKRNTP